MLCRSGSKNGSVIIPFSSIYPFYCHEMRICTLPSTRDGCSMEIDHQLILCCAFQQVDAILHGFLCITGKEVYLHSNHSHFIEPCKLLFSLYRIVQTFMRTGCSPFLNPTRRRIVPNQRFYSTFSGISQSIFNGTAVAHFIPFCINQYIG